MSAEKDERVVTVRWSFREVYEATMPLSRFTSLLPPDIDPEDQPAAWAFLEGAPDILSDYVADYPKSWAHRDEGSLELHAITPPASAS